MQQDPRSRLAQALEAVESEEGLESLGSLLASTLCAVSARLSSENPQIWNVSHGYVEGEVHVVFGPGQDLLKRH